MSKYDSQEFVKRLEDKIGNRMVPNCPYCGGEKFSAVQQFANIVVCDGFDRLELGNAVPSGMIVCENCGHVEFFALGALGMLEGKDNNGRKD